MIIKSLYQPDYYKPDFYCRSALDVCLNARRTLIVQGILIPQYELLPVGAVLQSDRYHYVINGALKALPLLHGGSTRSSNKGA